MPYDSKPTPSDVAAMQVIEDLLNAKKLSEVKKICKRAVITQTAFVDFVEACDSGLLRPWIHHIWGMNVVSVNFYHKTFGYENRSNHFDMTW
jgi:hypothetical protein